MSYRVLGSADACIAAMDSEARSRLYEEQARIFGGYTWLPLIFCTLPRGEAEEAIRHASQRLRDLKQLKLPFE